MNGKDIAQQLYAPADLAPSEETIHRQVVRWARMQESAIPELKLLHHSPNGGLRRKGTAGKMKAMGARKGFPDLMLPVTRVGIGADGQRRSFGGLFVELKSRNGRLRESQKRWRNWLTRHGQAWALCRSFEDARRCLMDYVRGDFNAALYADSR